jgi:hypothetical protein
MGGEGGTHAGVAFLCKSCQRGLQFMMKRERERERERQRERLIYRGKALETQNLI